jgi:(2R)-sulfolactate sulfo-lyase subunit alpha
MARRAHFWNTGVVQASFWPLMEHPVTVPQLLVHHSADNVGVVVVEGIAAGENLLAVCLEDDRDFRIVSNADVPIGHKVALRDLTAGEDAIKYGQVIGRIVADIRKGDHVHTQNLKTKRW